MDRRPLLILTTLAVLVVFFAADVAAQARFRGKVTDQWGNGLEGAQVVAERDGGGGSQEATTDDDGNFQLLLASGEYTFQFLADGYQGVGTSLTLSQQDSIRPVEVDLEALPSGGRFRGDTEFEAEGGVPRVKFDGDGLFEFEDAEGEGIGTYGIVESSAVMVVREYDGSGDQYSVNEPVVVTFTSDQFTSLIWGDATLVKQ